MAVAKDRNVERRLVNSYANVHVGQSEVGNHYKIMDLDGTVLEEKAVVASQGTLYVGNAYANSVVLIKRVHEEDEQ